MTSRWLDPYHGIDWEPTWRAVAGPVSLVDQSAEADLVRCLRELGFEVHFVEGGNIHDRQSLFEELANAFFFPDYFGKNWDAFNDCFGDFCLQREGPFAVIWRDSDKTIDHALREMLDSVAVFAETARMIGSIDAKPKTLQMKVFYLGSDKRGYIAKACGLR